MDAPILFPTDMDDLLTERFDAAILSIGAILRGRNDFADLYERWADRLTVRIDRRAQA